MPPCQTQVFPALPGASNGYMTAYGGKSSAPSRKKSCIFRKMCYNVWVRGVKRKPLARAKRIFGPVAQLGERSVRIREVESSSLFRSTTKETSFVYQDKRGFLCFQEQNSPQYRKIPLKQGLERSLRPCSLCFCFLSVKSARYFSRFFAQQRSWQNSTRRDLNSKMTAGVAEN